MNFYFLGGVLGALLLGGFIGVKFAGNDCVVQSCPILDSPRDAGISEQVSSSNRLSCSECLPYCNKELDEYINVYLKVRGLGTTVALREGLKY